MSRSEQISAVLAAFTLEDRPDGASIQELRRCKELLEIRRLAFDIQIYDDFPGEANQAVRANLLKEYAERQNLAANKYLEALQLLFEQNDIAVKNLTKQLTKANDDLKKALEDLKEFVQDMKAAKKAVDLVVDLVKLGVSIVA